MSLPARFDHEKLDVYNASDVLVAKRTLETDHVKPGKSLLVRIVQMLSKMVLNESKGKSGNQEMKNGGGGEHENDHDHEHEHGNGDEASP
jgi:hypothetical protein